MASGSAGEKARLARGSAQPVRSRRRSIFTCSNCMIVLVVLIACWLGIGRLLSSNEIVLDDFEEPALQDTTKHTPKETDRYLLGTGKADITGPVVEINLMGYADSKQVGSGVRQRLYSRAFIVGDLENPLDRFVYLVLDVQSGDTAVRYGILSGLKKLGPDYAMYRHDNLAVTATHSHSGPGAWLNYLLPQITSKGFDKQSYRAIVDGCILSIKRAHESLTPGHLSVGKTKVFGANINRSLFSYQHNPEEERAKYNISTEDDGTVEKDLTMLKFQRESDGKNMGVLTWFPTHGTSMTANNTLITGDNKGLAADLFEKKVRGGTGETDDFVAGFSQANMGDATPNVLGAYCEDGSGSKCDFKTSACANGRTRPCRGRGPFYYIKDGGASSCFEIARLQYQGAFDLYKDLNEQGHNIRGVGVKATHEFHNMKGFEFQLPNGDMAKTCPAALGYPFAAGTSDEPGHYDIVQHSSNEFNSSPKWKFIRWLLKTPSEEQKACQHPKNILLNVGEVSRPYQWTPNIVDIQTFRVGQFFIVVSPGEATTMAGRRWKDCVASHSKEMLADDMVGQEPIVVIGAPSNSYTHYITTIEEHAVQRYEGASTLYGPNTLAAYINRTIAALPYLAASKPVDKPRKKTSVRPPDNSERSFSFNTGVVYDRTQGGEAFGDVISDVSEGEYARGQNVSATFVGANPRNDLRLERTFAAVEYRREDGQGWKVVRDDSDWGLIYRWKRTSALWGLSEVTIEWVIEDWAAAGEYRLRYFGDAKSLWGNIHGFEGTSKGFRVD